MVSSMFVPEAILRGSGGCERRWVGAAGQDGNGEERQFGLGGAAAGGTTGGGGAGSRLQLTALGGFFVGFGLTRASPDSTLLRTARAGFSSLNAASEGYLTRYAGGHAVAIVERTSISRQAAEIAK